MNCQKHLFRIHPHIHYLNCAYKSPLLKASEQACIEALIRSRNPSDISVEEFFSEVEEVRIKFGMLINCNSSNVALMPSTSYGFASVLRNIKPKSNANVVTIKDEFPSGYFSLQSWCKDNHAELRIAAPDGTLSQQGKSWNDQIIASIDRNTRIVLISSVHWMNGLKYDLKRIGIKCREVGAFFIVDGTQSVGALSMDVQAFHIDALICASYKWLFGPYSLCLAYINDKFKDGKPLEESWMNRTNAKQFSQLTNYDDEYNSNAGRYNVGEASNFVLMPLLNESLGQILNWEVEKIQAYCKRLISPLIKYLNKIGGIVEDEKYFSNHLFSLKLPSYIDVTLLKQNMENNHVIISIRGSSLRISVNVFNDERDIEKLIEVLEMTKGI